MSITIPSSLFVELLSGVDVGLVGRHELDGAWSEIEELGTYNEFVDMFSGTLPCKTVLTVNGQVMTCEVKIVSCYDSDPEHCPCCAWETAILRKVS